MEKRMGKPKMKLFASGVHSPQPEEWGNRWDICLLLAENLEEARKMTDNPVEVSMEKACLLLSISEPSWGSDL